MLRELVPVRAGAMAALVVARAVLALVGSEAREAEDVERGMVGGVVRIVVGVGVEPEHVHNLLLEGMAVVTGLDMDLLLLKRRPGRFVVPDPALLELTVLLLAVVI
mmetsp:Transcript_46584/g.97481  ORF Transcript_46584/g.97481 Transcript_46584/m.97481 type:complete len:106 (-) Transcript_46584:537-854(-)